MAYISEIRLRALDDGGVIVARRRDPVHGRRLPVLTAADVDRLFAPRVVAPAATPASTWTPARVSAGAAVVTATVSLADAVVRWLS